MKLPVLLLVILYLAALAVALRDPSQHLVAGVVVLSAVLWRLRAAISRTSSGRAVRDRRSRRAAVVPAAPV